MSNKIKVALIGACATITAAGISAFVLFKNDDSQAGESIVNEINDGTNNTIETIHNELNNSSFELNDESVLIINNGTINNYGNEDANDTDNHENIPFSSIPVTESTPVPVSQNETDFSVSIDYKVNPIQVSASGIDIFITATTSLPATAVTISAMPDVNEHGAYNMYMGISSWWFNANFYEKGTYTITVTAYSVDGQTASDTFTYTY